VGGGYGNEASGDEAAIGGGVGNDAAGYAAAVGGGLGNQATADFATIAGGGRADVTDFYTANRVTDKYGTIGGGADNQAGDNRGSPSDATFATIGGGLSNTANSTAATVGGGYTNTITGTAATISGGEGNTAGASYVTIGGGADNEISVSPFNFFPEYATIAGGGENSVVGWSGNMLSWGYGATIGGGTNNTAGENWATIGGGYDNTVNGDSSTIGGGVENTIYGDSWYSTIGGGEENTIQRSIHHATIPGGLWNVAGGHYSFAAGFRAKANHEGSFVWGDSTIADFASERDDQFRVRASGGARFDVNNSGWANIYAQTAHATTVLIDTSTGAYLTAGGSWTNSSDRNAKENSALVNGRGVLARLAQLPISTWNYKAEDRSVRHMGPMAQDFFAAFGLGSDDKAIGTLDADGVALAAIQGLFEVVEEKDTEMAAMQTEIATLHRQNSDLEARVAALEQQTAGRHSPVSLGWLLSGCALAAVVAVGRRFAGDGP
jgi:hypothetical protein